ncbi:hypothetical protein KQX54_008792 [Cotesia glomerata]|uniref:Uncharacterized protein n=1 Tax=Cotesia glomerata TaxID=32391 RepID=A0AAV7I6T7_COTGL|nr:hypothetical protein KQX54_008792 [Cotesia glomerata]
MDKMSAELKATNETLKSLQTQLELAYASTASSGAPVAGSGIISGLGDYGGLLTSTATHLGGSVAVPGGVPGSSTLTAILETKDARIQTLEKEVSLLEAELQRIRECGGKLREQLLKATAVPSGIGSKSTTGVQHCGSGIVETSARGHSLSLPNALESLQSAVLTCGPSTVSSLVPKAQTPTSTLTNSIAANSSTGPSASCLTGISSGLSTGVVNPYAERHHSQQHHYHHHHHQYPQQHHQQHQHQIHQHLKHIEPAAAGVLALHAHTFNKHDLNFKRQVSFFINNVRIEKNDAI